MVGSLIEPEPWRSLRAELLAELDRLQGGDFDPRKVRPSDFSSISRRRAIINNPAWMPERPGRRMPPAKRVATYWRTRGAFNIDVSDPRCFCCGRQESSWGDLERAHLIDRAIGGLDNEPNLTMLCRTCHSQQPIFEIDEWDNALRWVQGRSWIRGAEPERARQTRSP